MPASTVPTAGTRKAIRTTSDYGQVVDGSYRPAQRYCNRCTIQWISGGSLYVGLQPPMGVSSTVSSTVYDIVLSAANPSFTIGPFGDDENAVDLGSTWLDTSANGTAYSFAPLT